MHNPLAIPQLYMHVYSCEVISLNVMCLQWTLYKRPAQAAFPIETPMTQYSRTFMVISLFHIAVMSSGPNMINMMRDTLPHSIVLTDSATHAQLLGL